MSISEHKTHCKLCNNEFARTNSRHIYCSTRCKNNYHKNNSYIKQQERGKRRKLLFIDEMGGRCSHCGYSRNSAALVFHHKNPESKLFPLDLRNLSNHSLSKLREELSKCELLCHNCHAELHHPEHNLREVRCSDH